MVGVFGTWVKGSTMKICAARSVTWTPTQCERPVGEIPSLSNGSIGVAAERDGTSVSPSVPDLPPLAIAIQAPDGAHGYSVSANENKIDRRQRVKRKPSSRK